MEQTRLPTNGQNADLPSLITTDRSTCSTGPELMVERILSVYLTYSGIFIDRFANPGQFKSIKICQPVNIHIRLQNPGLENEIGSMRKQLGLYIV